MSPPPEPPKKRNYVPFAAVLLVMTVICLLFAARKPDKTASEFAREKIDLGNAYLTDCVVDEINWVNDEKTLSRKLMGFWEKTGCQPYIYLKAYDAALSGDGNVSTREAFAAEYYQNHFADRPDVLLYIYFCDEFDEGIGEDTIQMGSASSVLMDANAIDIFWNYLYDDWDRWDPEDNDGMFADAFSRTADRIMTKTASGQDIARILAIAVAICSAGGFAVICIKMQHDRDREKAIETERILSTPIEKISDSVAEDLAAKYSGTDD